MGAAGRPAPDVEDRADRLGPLLHVEQPEVAGPLGRLAGVGLDPGAGVVDRQRRPVGRGRVADDDRRPAVLDRVRQRLLGDPEEGQLDVGRRTRAVGPLEADLAAGEPLDAQDEPVERRPDAEVVEDRQAQVAADRPQPVGHRPGDVGALGVAGGVEAVDEQGQVLERVVMDVGRDPGPFGLGRGDDEVALERPPGWRGGRAGGP